MENDEYCRYDKIFYFTPSKNEKGNLFQSECGNYFIDLPSMDILAQYDGQNCNSFIKISQIRVSGLNTKFPQELTNLFDKIMRKNHDYY